MLGGDINEINKESYLEKYVLTHDHEDIIRKSPQKSISYYALKPTPGRKPKLASAEIKNTVKEYRENLKKYQFYKNLRIHMEKVRILCSQVTKRENLKLRKELLEQDIFKSTQEAPKETPNITGQKRRGRKPKIAKEEPQPVKKVKKRAYYAEESEDEIDEEVNEMDEEDEEESEEEEEYSPYEEEEEEEPKPVVEVKRKRGRPPKQKPKSYIKRTSSLTSRQTQQEAVTPEQPAKRKRGRPPKNKVATTEEPQKISPKKKTTISPERSTSRKRSHSAKIKTPPKKKDKGAYISYIQLSPSTSRRTTSDVNPNEPADNYQVKPRGPILKKELQRILSHQSWNQFDILNKSATMGRVTRNSLSKPKIRKNKKNYSEEE